MWCIVASVRDSKQAKSSALDTLVTAIESVAYRDTMDKLWSRLEQVTSTEDMGLPQASRSCLDQVIATRRGLGLGSSGSAEDGSAAEKQILEMLPHVGTKSVRKALRDCSGDIDKVDRGEGKEGKGKTLNTIYVQFVSNTWAHSSCWTECRFSKTKRVYGKRNSVLE